MQFNSMKSLSLNYRKLKAELKNLVSNKSYGSSKIVFVCLIFAQRMLTSAKLWEPEKLLLYFFKSLHSVEPLYQISCFSIPLPRDLGHGQKRLPRPTEILKSPGLIVLMSGLLFPIIQIPLE